MQLSKILEILIALALIYFLFSTLVSLIFEWYSHKTQKRGRFLHQTILKLLNDPVNKSYGALLYNQYSISQLIKDKDSYPQYISSAMFADALIDIIGTQSESVHFENIFDPLDSKNLVDVKMAEDRFTDPYERFQKGIEKMKYSPLKSQLRAFQEKTKDYSELKKMIMEWFDDYMARVSGWYKHKTKKALFYISLLVSLTFNVDSITLIKKINSNENLRIDLVKQAETTVLEKKLKNMKTDSFNVATIDTTFFKQADSLVTEIENSAIPIGYQNDFKKLHQKNYYIFWFIGILISSFSLSFGAPFWFEVMVKAINVRRAGIKPS